jgi:hypothetical protein
MWTIFALFQLHLMKKRYLISGRFGGGVRMFANNLKEVYYFDLGMYEDLAIIPI